MNPVISPVRSTPCMASIAVVYQFRVLGGAIVLLVFVKKLDYQDPTDLFLTHDRCAKLGVLKR